MGRIFIYFFKYAKEDDTTDSTVEYLMRFWLMWMDCYAHVFGPSFCKQRLEMTTMMNDISLYIFDMKKSKMEKFSCFTMHCVYGWLDALLLTQMGYEFARTKHLQITILWERHAFPAFASCTPNHQPISLFWKLLLEPKGVWLTRIWQSRKQYSMF